MGCTDTVRVTGSDAIEKSAKGRCLISYTRATSETSQWNCVQILVRLSLPFVAEARANDNTVRTVRRLLGQVMATWSLPLRLFRAMPKRRIISQWIQCIQARLLIKSRNSAKITISLASSTAGSVSIFDRVDTPKATVTNKHDLSGYCGNRLNGNSRQVNTESSLRCDDPQYVCSGDSTEFCGGQNTFGFVCLYGPKPSTRS